VSRKLYQLRFPKGETAQINEMADNLISGNAFSQYAQQGIEQLGIQAPPGTKFLLNKGPDPIIVGASGIYELSLTNQLAITDLRFYRESINKIRESNGVLTLLVDIIYREG
jgi:hypothetical protein